MPKPKPSLPEPTQFEASVLQVPRLPGFAVVGRVFRGDCPQSYTPVVRVVGFVLADALNKNDECWLSVPTIAHRAGCSERAAQKALRRLTADPPVFVRQRRRGQSSVYKLVRHPDKFMANRDTVRQELRTSDAKQAFLEKYRDVAGAGVRSMDTPKVTKFRPSNAAAGKCGHCGQVIQTFSDGFVGDYLRCVGDVRVPHVCPRNEPEPALAGGGEYSSP